MTKRISASQPKSPPPPRPPPQLTSTPEARDKCGYIKVRESERVLTVLRHENKTKALILMKEFMQKYGDTSGEIHRIQSYVYHGVALSVAEPHLKQKHLRNAVQSARKAIELNPNSLESLYFLAYLLYELADHEDDFEEVIQVCEMGLSVKKPCKISESDWDLPTPEKQIAKMRELLQSLTKSARIALSCIKTGAEKPLVSPVKWAWGDDEIPKKRKESDGRVAGLRALKKIPFPPDKHINLQDSPEQDILFHPDKLPATYYGEATGSDVDNQNMKFKEPEQFVDNSSGRHVLKSSSCSTAYLTEGSSSVTPSPAEHMQRLLKDCSWKKNLGALITEKSGNTNCLGIGLRNVNGANNCFLNAIIQALFRITQFQEQILCSFERHRDDGYSCVFCGLFDVFTSLNIALDDPQEGPVSPRSLRSALSKFAEGQMNDAAEVLEIIFDSLHGSFVQDSGVLEIESQQSNDYGNWDCSSHACIAHIFFGMDIDEKIICESCGLENLRRKYTTFFQNLNASALRAAKVKQANSSFEELFKYVEMSSKLGCNSEKGGCGMLNTVQLFLRAPPHVFITVLVWQSAAESKDDLSATLAVLNSEIDIGILFRGLDPGNKYRLVSVVCYGMLHYICFTCCPEYEMWIKYDDEFIEKVGDWNAVLETCTKQSYQPLILFFEAVKTK